MSAMPGQSLPPNEVIAAAIQDTLREESRARLATWIEGGGQLDDLRLAVLAALNHPATDIRRRALLLIADWPGDNSAYRDAVVAALSDPAWSVREIAVAVAGQFPDPDDELHKTLIAMSLADPKPHVRRAVAEAVGPRIEPERDYGSAIRHRFERQRIRAAFAVAHAPPEKAAEALQLLRVALADNHMKVRRAALQGLLLMPRMTVRLLLPIVIRKCAEANPSVAAAAWKVWNEVLHVRHEDEPLRPLQPFAASTDVAGLRAAIEPLSANHPLLKAWKSIPTPADKIYNSHRFARLLAMLCEHVLTADINRT